MKWPTTLRSLSLIAGAFIAALTMTGPAFAQHGVGVGHAGVGGFHGGYGWGGGDGGGGGGGGAEAAGFAAATAGEAATAGGAGMDGGAATASTVPGRGQAWGWVCISPRCRCTTPRCGGTAFLTTTRTTPTIAGTAW